MAKRPIYYDTETTGVDPKSERIVEIAAFDPVLNKTFQRLVNPQMAIPKEAMAIHGITDEMVASASTFAEVGKEFTEFCAGEVVLIAHNNDAFDRYFLEHEYARHNIALPDWSMLDTLKWARKYRPDLPKHSLQFLRQVYGIAENNAHRALDDVQVLYEIFSVMLDDLSMEQALDLLYSKQSMTTENVMPFGKHKGMPLNEVPKNYLSWLKTQDILKKKENQALKEAIEQLA